MNKFLFNNISKKKNQKNKSNNGWDYNLYNNLNSFYFH